MADTSFPAHITVDRVVDLDGMPQLTAAVSVDTEVAALPLPAGPAGPAGPQGRPRTTFQKMGEIADAAARPAGLGPEDRGKWWHRLDTDGMDIWDGTGWKHSPGAVGPQGPIAEANSITVVDTVHNENLTVAGVEFTGNGAAQDLRVTVPAGEPGPVGPPGASGEIGTSPDFDSGPGAAERSPFAWNTASRKFRAVAPPNGYGPWSWYGTDFAANTGEQAVDKLIAGTFTIAALPFRWRPIVYGNVNIYVSSISAYVRASCRLYTTEGVMVSAFKQKTGANVYRYVSMAPYYADDETSRSLSPTSTYATVPAGQDCTLVVVVERLGVSSGSTIQIGWNQSRASLVCYAQPL